MRLLALNDCVPADHRVRLVWQFVESLDLSEIYSSIKAVKGHVGRDPIDPRILFCLWLFATIEGITSARRLDDLTTRDVAYMWICGGVTVNYHRLSDFRVEHGELLERILKNSIAVPHAQGLVTMETLAQDGMRVRASAGTGSFRRKESLDEALEIAQAHLEKLRKQQAENPEEGTARERAARDRAARERVERIEAAREQMKGLEARRERRESGKPTSAPRASTTDPDALRMKMGDGGTRPAFNTQFVSDGDSQMIVSVEVTNQGSDSGLMGPAYDAVTEEYELTPANYMVDGGFGKKEDVTHLEQQGTKVFAPLYAEKKQLEEGKDPYAARKGETPEMTAHRERMGTEEGKAMYRRRPAIAEFPNADCRNRGLTQFRVRGLVKAKAQALWHALTFNFMRMKNLACDVRNQSYLEIVMGI